MITINLKCENAHETPCKTLQEQRCLHLCSWFVCPPTIWSSYFNSMCFKYSHLFVYILTRIFKLQFRRVNCYFFGDGWLAGAPLIDRISRLLIAICDVIFHRRLIAIKKQKRRLDRINRIAPFLARFTTLSATKKHLISAAFMGEATAVPSYDAPFIEFREKILACRLAKLRLDLKNKLVPDFSKS